jgi:hypothetical protein
VPSFAVPESPLLQFPSIAVHICSLLEARMVVTAYNSHCWLSRNCAAGASMIWNPRLAALRLR